MFHVTAFVTPAEANPGIESQITAAVHRANAGFAAEGAPKTALIEDPQRLLTRARTCGPLATATEDAADQ